jgi:hypothetical protein
MMKRSFYDMLGLRGDADQAQIEAAYTKIISRLGATTDMRGASETLRETELIHEGYRILSDPARRAIYDTKVLTPPAAVAPEFVADEPAAHRKLTIQIAAFALIAVVCGVVAWSQVAQRIERVRVEHQHALAKQKGPGTPPPVAVQTVEPKEAGEPVAKQ